MQHGRLNVRSSRRSVSNNKRWLSDMNRVKGSPAIIYSSTRCDSDPHEPMVCPEVQRQQRLDLQRQQRQSQHLSYPAKRDCGVSQRAKRPRITRIFLIYLNIWQIVWKFGGKMLIFAPSKLNRGRRWTPQASYFYAPNIKQTI